MKLIVQLAPPAKDHTDPQYRTVEAGQKDWKFDIGLESNELFYRTKLNGNLVLTGEDFIWLHQQYELFPCCVEVAVNVLTNNCTGEGTELFWPGYFLFSSVKWDFYACSATISTVQPRDGYDAIFKCWNKPVNLLEGAALRVPFVAVYPDKYSFEVNPDTGDIEKKLPDGNKAGMGASTQEHEYTQGLDFSYALGWALEAATKDTPASVIFGIKSDFFYSPINPVTGRPNLQRVLMQGSDAKRPFSKKPAVNMMTTLKELLDDLRGLFNVYWMLDTTNNVLIIEHYRWFNQRSYKDLGRVTLNLQKYPDALKTANNESVDVSGLYGSEEITISNNNSSLLNEFKSGSVRYDTECVPRDDKGSVTANSIPVDKMWTDLMAGYLTADSIPDDSLFLAEVVAPHSSNVFVNLSSNLPILATDLQYKVYQDNVIVAEGLGLCGTLAASKLFTDYHRDGRSFTSGLVNQVKQTDGSYSDGQRMGMYSTRRTVKQENITIPMCCSDLPMNLDGYIKTQRFDRSKLEKGSYDPIAETLTLSVMANSKCEQAAVVVEPSNPDTDCAPHGTYVEVKTEIAYCSDGVTEMSRTVIYVYADGQCGTYEVPGVSGGNGGC